MELAMNDNNLEKIIKESYEIQINNITKNFDSTDGNVYLIKSNNNKYIFKIYNSLEHTQSMIKLHNFLNENNLYVPRIIQTENKEYYKRYNDKYIVMYSFLEGMQLKNIIQTVDNKTILKLAKEIRRLHDLTENVTFNLKHIDFNLETESKRKSVLHFDLTKDNIFINKDKVGFIDFDDAKFGPSVYDVAITISLLFLSKSRGAELDKIKTFIDSYYESDTQNKERELPYIKSIALKWIDYLLTKNSFDTSTKESFEVKKKLIEEYL